MRARPREADRLQLQGLIATKERIGNLEHAEIKLAECCERLKSVLDTAGYQDKRDILEILAIKVTATPEKVNIDGIIPLDSMFSQSQDGSSNLLTTGQTWACMLIHNKSGSATQPNITFSTML